MLKVNEFTLVGAVLADKRNGGEPTHSSPKSATFSKEYNSSRHAQLFGPSACSGTLQRHNHPGWIHYAQGTLRPCSPRAMASHCLILVFVKVSSFQVKNKSDTQRAFTLVLADNSKLFLDIKKAWSWMHLSTRRPRQPDYKQAQTTHAPKGRLHTGRLLFKQ